ncbi:hypothetical protein DTR57_10225 [Salmonella enterica]|nr:hypothetical protein [Salmonella enterica]
MGSCAAPSAKGDDKFITTDYLQQCLKNNNPTESELQQLAQLRTKVESSLQTVGLRPRTMTAVNYIRIMSTILNWGPDASWRHDSVDWEMDKPICEQIFDYGTDVEVSS